MVKLEEYSCMNEYTTNNSENRWKDTIQTKHEGYTQSISFLKSYRSELKDLSKEEFVEKVTECYMNDTSSKLDVLDFQDILSKAEEKDSLIKGKVNLDKIISNYQIKLSENSTLGSSF